MVVTISRGGSASLAAQARTLAARLGVRYVAREGHALARLLEMGQPDPGGPAGVLVVGERGLRLHTYAGEFYFHPGMARHRVRRLAGGQADLMVTAMALQPGDSVLDCTLGLGADAIVASFAAGPAGAVVGVESSPVLGEIVRSGLATYVSGDPGLDAAMRRIEVQLGDHLDVLAALPPASFDVVYFDPMFRQPVVESVHMVPWRALADPRPVSGEAVVLARRVARRRVVLKERRDSPVFADLGFHQAPGGRSSRVAYGYIQTGEV